MTPAFPARASAWLLAACLGWFSSPARAEAGALEIGIVPYLPTAQLMGAFNPLADFLERKLKRPVNLSTAPDFHTHLARVLRREYGLIVTGPTPGRLGEKDAGYAPLLVSRRNVQAVIVAPKGSGLLSPAQLRGKRIATWEPMSATAQLGQEMLRQAKIDPQRDAVLSEVKTPYNAAQAAFLGEADAAVVPVQLFPGLPEEMKAKLRIIARSRELPGVMVLSQSAAGLPPAAELRKLLLEFFEADGAGRALVARLEYEGFRPPSRAELAALDNLLPEMRRHLGR